MRLSRPSKRILFFAVVFVTLFMLILPRRLSGPLHGISITLAAPIQKPLSWAARFLSNSWRDLSARRDLAAENRALKEKVSALENNLVRITSDLVVVKDKVLSFDALAKLPTSAEVRGVDANVIGEDTSNVRFSIEIDRGSTDGVEAGQAVVWREAVVGVVTTAAWKSSQVLLLADPGCRIAGYDVRSREQCIVEGTGDGFCRLKYVPRDRDVQKGDLIVTSGTGGIFPPSFLIGQVVESVVPESGLFRQIKVQPRVSFSRLQSVLVLCPALPPEKQKDSTEGHPAHSKPPQTKRKTKTTSPEPRTPNPEP